MREAHRAERLDSRASAYAPHGAGEIAQTVDQEERRFLKRRDKKGASQMGLVMFHAPDLDLAGRQFQGLGGGVGDSGEFIQHTQTTADKAWQPEGIQGLLRRP